VTFGLSAIAAVVLKSVLGGLWRPELSHRQREALETAQALGQVRAMPAQIGKALSPTLLWNTLQWWTSRSFGGVSPRAAMTSYVSPHFGQRVYIGRPFDSIVGGTQLGDPADFVNCDPDTISVRIQAGVAPGFLGDAEAVIRLQIQRVLGYLQGAMDGDPHSLRVLAHVWALAQPPVTWNIDAAIDPLIEAEVPLLAETLRTLYYTHIAQAYGFTRYTDLFGVVLQERWTAHVHGQSERYRAALAAWAVRPAGPRPVPDYSWTSFMQALGYTDFRQLRRDIFRGRLGTGGNDAMFEQMAQRLDRLEYNVDQIVRVILPGVVRPYLLTLVPDAQGVLHPVYPFADNTSDTGYAPSGGGDVTDTPADTTSSGGSGEAV
jgi:hypothetical protein